MGLVIAGQVWAAVGEVYFDTAVVVEENCRVADWRLSKGVLVVDAEGSIACVAVGRRGSGLPSTTGLGSASAQRTKANEIYLFWLCVSNNINHSVSTGHTPNDGDKKLLLTQEAHLDYIRCCRPS